MHRRLDFRYVVELWCLYEEYLQQGLPPEKAQEHAIDEFCERHDVPRTE